MSRVFAIAAIITAIVAGTYFLFIKNDKSSELPKENLPAAGEPTPQSEFTASFEIYTNGLKRDFSAEMYHNLSEDVYIQNPDPSVIYIKKSEITWNDFFETMPAPFSLTTECLTTGTGQKFCNSQGKTLKFMLNSKETPNVLDLEIKEDDRLIIQFGS